MVSYLLGMSPNDRKITQGALLPNNDHVDDQVFSIQEQLGGIQQPNSVTSHWHSQGKLEKQKTFEHQNVPFLLLLRCKPIF